MTISKTHRIPLLFCILIIISLAVYVMSGGMLSGDSPVSEIAATEEESHISGIMRSGTLMPPLLDSDIPMEDNFDPHPIHIASSFADAFPDNNDVQLESAQLLGVSPVENREEAENRKSDFVYVGTGMTYSVDNLPNSIPYLVPRAAVLLQDIGRTFFDSLYVKRMPMHRIVVTSILRTKEDVVRLRRHNRNASERSCHCYGTTFDISYNRYDRLAMPPSPLVRVRKDSLKWVLSEVLYDMRQQGRCYVKYEVKQGCFHVTVR